MAHQPFLYKMEKRTIFGYSPSKGTPEYKRFVKFASKRNITISTALTLLLLANLIRSIFIVQSVKTQTASMLLIVAPIVALGILIIFMVKARRDYSDNHTSAAEDVSELLDRYAFISDANSPEAVQLDGKNMSDPTSICEEIYRELRLDEYFPYANLDGLDEILSKIMWPESEQISLQINNFDEFLKNNSKESVETLFEIFKEKNEDWQGNFMVFIQKSN